MGKKMKKMSILALSNASISFTILFWVEIGQNTNIQSKVCNKKPFILSLYNLYRIQNTKSMENSISRAELHYSFSAVQVVHLLCNTSILVGSI